LPDQKYATDKIFEIHALIKKNENLEKNYQSAITKGTQYYADKKYELAITEFETALTLKPGESVPTTKITEIRKITAAIAEYQEAIGLADELYLNKEYEKAKTAYLQAQSVKPDEKYPQSMIGRIDETTANIAGEQQARQQSYDQAVAAGDGFFRSRDYSEARASFESALKIMPSESYPRAKINEIENLLANVELQEKQYAQFLVDGDKYYGEQKLNEALSAFQGAEKIKPDESYPKTKIAEITTLLAGIKQIEQDYQAAIAKADQEFTAKKYDLAKSAFENASTIKPEESYPKTKIAEIAALIEAIKMTEQNFQAAIIKADKEFGAKNYELAKSEYQNASNLKPDESYPKARIAEISALLTGIRQTEQDYLSAIAKADQEFTAKNYDLAKADYQNASAIKPEESYPKTKIAEITTLLAGIQQTEKKYQSAIAKADQEFGAKNYDLAKADYQNASGIKPDESYPKTKIAEITTLLAGIQQTEQNYQAAIAKADQEFTAKNYNLAKADYQNASTIKPEESYPKTKIAEITTLLAGIQQTEQNYQAAIAKADQEFGAKNYDLAKTDYQNASTIKPEESYPKTKIVEITTLLAGIQQTEQNYQAAIAKADLEFGAKNYELAKDDYQNASTIKPEESYPKTKIAEILAFEVNRKNYDAFIASGNFQYDAENFHMARNSYNEALKLFPDEPYPKERLKDIEAILLAESERIQKEYNIAISEADRFFAGKVYDNAIEYYMQASGIKPDEAYPIDRINAITKLIQENVVVDVLKQNTTIESGILKQYDFTPVLRQGRKESYVIIKMKNLSENDFRLFLNYGKGAAKNGGFVINIPKSENLRDYVIRVGGQYKWVSEDNNWISLQPEGGNAEILVIQISQE
jgi:tetratricopeptide (TPR) repeat protein